MTQAKEQILGTVGTDADPYQYRIHIPEIRSVVSDAEVHERREIFLNYWENTAVAMGRAGFYRFANTRGWLRSFLEAIGSIDTITTASTD